MRASVVIVFALLRAAASQDAPAAAAPPPAELLRDTLARMLTLRSVSFDCELRERQSAALPFGGRTRRVQLSGIIEPERGMQAAIGTGDHEILELRDHCVVRRAGGPWLLRRGYLAAGQPMPFLPDLLALCRGLLAVREHAKARAGTGGDGEHQQLELAVDGKAARELMWSGALPPPAADLDRVVLGLAVPGVDVAEPKIRYEISLTVDPHARLLRQVVVRGYKERGDQGGVGVEFEVATPEDARRLEEMRRALGTGREERDPRASVELTLSFADFDRAKLHVPEEVSDLLQCGPERRPAPTGR